MLPSVEQGMGHSLAAILKLDTLCASWERKKLREEFHSEDAECNPDHRLLTCPNRCGLTGNPQSQILYERCCIEQKHLDKVFVLNIYVSINLVTQWHLSLCIRFVVFLRRHWTLTSVNLKRVCSFWFDSGCSHRKRSPCYWKLCVVYFLPGKTGFWLTLQWRRPLAKARVRGAPAVGCQHWASDSLCHLCAISQMQGGPFPLAALIFHKD